MKKLPLIIAILFFACTAKTFSQSLGYSGGLCVGNQVRIYLMGGSSCGTPVVPSQTNWTINPTPASVTYIQQGPGSYPQIQVAWNTPVNANIRVSYSCNADGSNGQTNDLLLSISSAVTPTVSLANISNVCHQNGSINLVATPTHGGPSPSYNFYVDGALVHNGNLSSYNFNTSALSVGSHTAYVGMSSSLTCATAPSFVTSATKAFTVTAKSTYTLTINGPPAICSANASATLFAIVGNPVGTMSYQWYLNGNAFGAASASPSLQFNSLSNGNTIYCRASSDFWCANSPVQSNTYTVVFTASVNPSVAIQVPKLNYCVGETITFTSSIAAASYIWKLNGGTTFSTSQVTTLPTSMDVNAPNTFSPGDVVTLETSGLTGACLTSSTANATTVGVPLNVFPYPSAVMTPAPGIITIPFSGSQSMSVPALSNQSYQWRKDNEIIPTEITQTYITSKAGAYKVLVTSNNCTSVSGILNVRLNVLPIVSAGPDKNVVFPAATISLPGSATDSDGSIVSYLWEKQSGGAATLSGANTNTLVVANAHSGSYTFKLTATDNTGDSQSDYVNVAVYPLNNYNYVREQIIMAKDIENSNAILTLQMGIRAETYNYFDGLGRVHETVNTQASPLQKDMVQPVAYDAFGRENKKYLPYISTDMNGYYKHNPVGSDTYTGSPQYNYYQNGNGDNVADDTFPFSETFFESSPLSRPNKFMDPVKIGDRLVRVEMINLFYSSTWLIRIILLQAQQEKKLLPGKLIQAACP